MHVTACELFYLNIDLKTILVVGDEGILSCLSSLVFLLTPLLYFFRVKVLVLISLRRNQLTDNRIVQLHYSCVSSLFPYLVPSRSF